MFLSRGKINHQYIVIMLLFSLWCTDKYMLIQTFHINIRIWWCTDGSHCATFYLEIIDAVEMKWLRVNIRIRNLIIGLPVWAFSFNCFLLTASLPSWLEVLVYEHFTTISTNIVSHVSSCMSLTFLLKSEVSLTYDGRFCTCGCK